MSHLRSLSPVVMFLLLGSWLGTAAWGETVGSGVPKRRKPAETTDRDVLPADFREPRELAARPTKRSRATGSSSQASFAMHEFGTMHKAERAQAVSTQAGKVRRASGYEMVSEGNEFEENYDDLGGSCGPNGCGGGCGDSCDSGSCSGPTGWVGGSMFGGLLKSAEYATGMQSFYGPANRGGAGSGGFHQGINLAIPCFEDVWGVGLQGGVLFTQSNLNGALFTNDSRNQVFATFGAFRRVDWGFQWGLVVDYMRDDWYYQIDLHQLRGELSWKMPEAGEIGFTFTNGLGTDTANSVILTNGIPATIAETWVVNDMYTFFARHTFCNGLEGRLFAGFTGDSDGLIGANINMPMTDSWSIRTDALYMHAAQGKFDGGVQQESWNLALSLVWNPCNTRCGNYYRPLFNVANNNSFLSDRR